MSISYPVSVLPEGNSHRPSRLCQAGHAPIAMDRPTPSRRSKPRFVSGFRARAISSRYAVPPPSVPDEVGALPREGAGEGAGSGRLRPADGRAAFGAAGRGGVEGVAAAGASGRVAPVESDQTNNLRDRANRCENDHHDECASDRKPPDCAPGWSSRGVLLRPSSFGESGWVGVHRFHERRANGAGEVPGAEDGGVRKSAGALGRRSQQLDFVQACSKRLPGLNSCRGLHLAAGCRLNDDVKLHRCVCTPKVRRPPGNQDEINRDKPDATPRRALWKHRGWAGVSEFVAHPAAILLNHGEPDRRDEPWRVRCGKRAERNRDNPHKQDDTEPTQAKRSE